MNSLEEKVLEIIKDEHGRPLPYGILFRKALGKASHNFDKKREIEKAVKHLIEQGSVKELSGSHSLVLGSYQPHPLDMNKKQEGVIAINTSGTGFITIEGEKKSSFIVHKTQVNGALNGDKVLFAPTTKKTEEGDLIEAGVLEILEHKKNYFVVLYTKEGLDDIFTPDDSKMYKTIKVKNIPSSLVTGTKLLVRVEQFEKDTAICSIVQEIGNKDDVGVDILSLVLDAGVEPEFSQEVMDYVNKKKFEITDKQKKLRKDIRNLNTITIDPATSKDFDDAYFLEKKGEDFHLYVSIADVSTYVEYESVLDIEAAKRTSSIYLVDRVIPMLPHLLSNDICSINPNEDRFAMTCEMIIDKKGEFKDIQVYPSIINSHRRFAYGEVNEYFKTGKSPKDTPETLHMLDLSMEIHKVLRIKKEQKGYINLSNPEPMIVLNDKNEIVDIKVREHGDAEEMIEDLMVLCNEAVTLNAQKKGYPYVYRVHEPPDPEKLHNFEMQVKPLGFKIPGGLDNPTSKDINS